MQQSSLRACVRAFLDPTLPPATILEHRPDFAASYQWTTDPPPPARALAPLTDSATSPSADPPEASTSATTLTARSTTPDRDSDGAPPRTRTRRATTPPTERARSEAGHLERTAAAGVAEAELDREREAERDAGVAEAWRVYVVGHGRVMADLMGMALGPIEKGKLLDTKVDELKVDREATLSAIEERLRRAGDRAVGEGPQERPQMKEERTA